ncbi:MAG: peptidase and in, kexin, sedolisin, partial [Candidatus Solibacter sp.]|nr:peptidase and in, kexin, sedolisin [Candidatus Solibacter sp.]
MSFFNARRTAVSVLILSALPGFAQEYTNHYALILKDPAVSARFAGREAVRSAAAESYRQQLVRTHDSVSQALTARAIPMTGSVDVVMNAVFVTATPDRVAELQQLPGVLAVLPMRAVRPSMNRATTLQNAPAAWTALGGQANAGAGMKVGIIDFGIDQTHPALQDSSLSMPAGFPKCTDGHPEDCAYTTNKVIVARVYTRLTGAGSSSTNPAADSRPDDYSPRDREGHGTAIASVIAANPTPGVVTISGMAPKAWLGNYKVYGSPYVNDYPPESVFIQAVDDAVKDGMDVVNLSSGITATTGALDTGATCGLAVNVPCDPLGLAYENAAKAGVVVVVAAGNNGYDGVTYPAFNTISTPAVAPSVIAVGAVTNSHFFTSTVTVAGGPSTLQNIPGQPGDDPYSPVGAYAAPVRDVSTVSSDGLGCSGFPAGSLTGTFALIQRGTCNFYTKVDNAFDAGAAGVIMYMADATAPIGPGN